MDSEIKGQQKFGALSLARGRVMEKDQKGQYYLPLLLFKWSPT